MLVAGPCLGRSSKSSCRMKYLKTVSETTAWRVNLMVEWKVKETPKWVRMKYKVLLPFWLTYSEKEAEVSLKFPCSSRLEVPALSFLWLQVTMNIFFQVFVYISNFSQGLLISLSTYLSNPWCSYSYKLKKNSIPIDFLSYLIQQTIIVYNFVNEQIC